MRYAKKAKNAEHLGLRFSISFFRMKDELVANVQNENGFSMERVQITYPSDIIFTI